VAETNLRKKNAVLGIRVDTTRIFLSPTFIHDPFCCDAKRCGPQPQDKHEYVRAASSIHLPLDNTVLEVDGIQVAVGDRILVRAQSNPVDNGIYVVEDPAWVRAKDADTDGDLVQGSYIYVEQGKNYGTASFQLVTPNPVQIGTSSLDWELFFPAGASDEKLVTDRVANSLYENTNFIEFLMDPKYFFDQFSHPVSWNYILNSDFTATVPPNLPRDAIYNPYFLPGIVVPDTILLRPEDGDDETISYTYSKYYPDGRSVVLRYWKPPAEPDFIFLDYLQLPDNEHETGKQLPDGICKMAYKWVFNHNRNYHDIYFTALDANIPPGTSLSSHGLLTVDQFPEEPGEWYILMLAKDMVKKKDYTLRFDFRSRLRDSETLEGSGGLKLSMAPYATGSCSGLKLHLDFEVNYQYNATRILKVTGGAPPYRFIFFNERDEEIDPTKFDDFSNSPSNWFGMWYLEPETDPDSTETWLPDTRSKVSDFTGYDVNSYRVDSDSLLNNQMRAITNTSYLPGLFQFQQINETMVLFLMNKRGFYEYGYSEKDDRLQDVWKKLPMKMRVVDSEGSTDEIDISINNCLGVYEKIWTLDQTYYVQDENTGAVAGVPELLADSVSSIPVEYGGREYDFVPQVVITGGGGSGATATAVVANKSVVALVVTNGGQDYTSPPEVYIEESIGRIKRVSTRDLISAYGNLYFDGSARPGLVHPLLRYNGCGYGAIPRVVNS